MASNWWDYPDCGKSTKYNPMKRSKNCPRRKEIDELTSVWKEVYSSIGWDGKFVPDFADYITRPQMAKKMIQGLVKATPRYLKQQYNKHWSGQM